MDHTLGNAQQEGHTVDSAIHALKAQRTESVNARLLGVWIKGSLRRNGVVRVSVSNRKTTYLGGF